MLPGKPGHIFLHKYEGEKQKTKQSQILKQVKLSFTFFISIHITYIAIYTRELTLPLI